MLFRPEWGTFDMAVGESIVSVFTGAADKTAYQDIPLVPKERTIKVTYDESMRQLHTLYRQIREIRESESGHDGLETLWRKQQADHPDLRIFALHDDEMGPITLFARREALAR